MSLKIEKPVPSDIEIAQAAELLPIVRVAAMLGLAEDDLDLYGRTRPRSTSTSWTGSKTARSGRYVDVTAITPTPLGEGKTTTTVGLSQALGAHLGKKVFTVRPPAQHGPHLRDQGRRRRAAAIARSCPWRTSTST